MNDDIKPSPSTAQPTPPTQPVVTASAPVQAPVLSQPVLSSQPEDTQDKPKKTGGWRSAISTILVILIAPALALTITAFVFQSYEVDGQSMSTTLTDHDRLVIWKVSRTWARVTHKNYIPKRGDVIVFIKRGLYEGNSTKEKQLIKRVIALPGERVTVKEGVVTVYNTAHPDGFIPDKTLPYGTAIGTTEGNVDVTVAAGEVFVCGDNRGNSLDSRYFGPIPSNDIVGKLIARILPISDAEKF